MLGGWGAVEASESEKVVERRSRISLGNGAMMGENRKVGTGTVEGGNHVPNQSPWTEDDMAPSKSTKAPAFQFFPRDFLSSPKVDRMPMTERGAYITLLCRCWLDNGLPTDLDELAFFCRMKPAQFERMWKNGRIGQCFYELAGKFHNERLDVERKKQAVNRQRQSDNAAMRWKKSGNATAMPPHESGITRAHAPAADADSKQQISSVVSSEERLDLAFASFRDAYPESRRKGGFLVQQDYMAAASDNGPVVLMNALRNHIASEQWANPKHIPGMDVWLKEERWRQELPAAGAVSSSQNNPKTAGNVPAFRRFIERGRPA
jgi:uncharacterized protein YdaU (DUF1376 family)